MSIPAGYTPLPDGTYTKSDGSGPYVFDGTAMALAATGTGGGGGGGGGAVTVADGADVTQGAVADAAVAAGAAGTLSAKLRAISRDVAAALPAGTNPIGKVSIDQTTPGTSNAVQVIGASVRQIDVALNALTLNAAVTVAIDGGIGEVGFDIVGLTATGAIITFEGTNNVGAGTPHWAAIQSIQGSTLSSTAAADGAYRVETGGRTAIRARISTIGSAGNVTISTATSQVGSLVTLAQAIPTGTNQIGDVRGPATTNVSSATYEKSHVLSATPARLFSLTGHNSGVDQFYQLHDAATLPADTAVPKAIIFVPANTSFAFDFGVRGRNFTTGIVVCNSSTGPTKTLGATADSWFDAQVG